MSKRKRQFSIKLSPDRPPLHLAITNGEIHLLDERPPTVAEMELLIKQLRERGIEVSTPYNEFQPDATATQIALPICLCG